MRGGTQLSSAKRLQMGHERNANKENWVAARSLKNTALDDLE